MRNFVHEHRGNDMRIVSLFADNPILNYESFPLG